MSNTWGNRCALIPVSAICPIMTLSPEKLSRGVNCQWTWLSSIPNSPNALFMMSVNLDAEDLRLAFPNQSLDDFSQTYAFFGIVIAVLVVSAELSGIPIVLLVVSEFLIGRLRYYLVLVHENSLISGVEQSENFLKRS
ncbi:unnamed protein product [Prunus brigantina]